jgi:hypothetical protein
VVRRPGGELEFALRGDADAAASVLTAAVRSGVRCSSFGPAASDLEELFLQITEANSATATADISPTLAAAADNDQAPTTEMQA